MAISPNTTSTTNAPEGDPVIVVCGEALIDLTHGSGDAHLAYQGHVGGGPCNTAVAIGRQGVPVAFLGRSSTDQFGEAIRAHMVASHVGQQFLPTTAEPSMLAIATIGAAGNAHYAFYLDATADVGLTSEALPDLPASVAILHFGTLALALEPVGASLVALAEREKGRRLIALDPNVRMMAIRDVPAYRARIEALIALADVVKISDADIEGLWPNESVDEFAARLAASGPALLCLTRGGDGVSVYHRSTNGEPVHVPAGKVQVVDTIGAGDTFNAGLLCHLVSLGAISHDAIAALSSEAVLGAVTFAARAAAITCSRAGANPPWANEL